VERPPRSHFHTVDEVTIRRAARPLNADSPPHLSAVHRALLANAASMVGTTGATAALGVVYWVLAARQFPSSAVGFASASVSAMLLLGSLPVLGLQTLMVAELHRRPTQEASFIATALLAAGGVGGAFGLIFALVASRVAPELAPLGESIGTILLFAAGVSLTAITLVTDKALIGLLRGEMQFGRNVLFAGAKLLALLLVGLWMTDRFGLMIFGTWVIGNLLSLAGLAAVAAMSGHLTIAARPRWQLLRGLGRAAVGHQVLNLAIQIPPLVLPLVVTVLISASVNAYFYTAWMMAGLVFIGPESLAMVLYAVGTRMSAGVVRTLRLTIGLSLLVALTATVLIFIFANDLLSLFGPAYTSQAALILRILALGVFPLIVKMQYVAIFRIRGRPAAALPLMAVGAMFEVVLAAIGARIDGLTGLSVGWLIGASIEAMLIAPTVVRFAAWGDVRQEHRWLAASLGSGIKS
jgi:O-antigen/teichoic acid export membrane protein